jgi:hypothetical protein
MGRDQFIPLWGLLERRRFRVSCAPRSLLICIRGAKSLDLDRQPAFRVVWRGFDLILG